MRYCPSNEDNLRYKMYTLVNRVYHTHFSYSIIYFWSVNTDTSYVDLCIHTVTQYEQRMVDLNFAPITSSSSHSQTHRFVRTYIFSFS